MIQQIIAFSIIAFFLSRLFWQKKKGQLGGNEFAFWLFFWLVVAVAILLLKTIDRFVASLGFSGSGIEVLLYLGVATSFYLIFRLRLHIAKMDKNISDLVKIIAIKNENSENKK